MGQAQGQIFALKLAEKLARRACAWADYKADFGPEKRTVEHEKRAVRPGGRLFGPFPATKKMLGCSAAPQAAPSGSAWNNRKGFGRNGLRPHRKHSIRLGSKMCTLP